jgi:hypothetical protein
LKQGGLLAVVAAMVASLALSMELHWSGAQPNIYSDLFNFYQRPWMLANAFPYIGKGPDFTFEYPVLSGAILYVTKLVGGQTYDGFYLAFCAFSLVAGLAVAWASWGAARRLGKSFSPMYFLMPSYIIYGVYNFDLFHTAFVLLSVFAFLSGRKTASAVLLGLAVDTKLTSVVLLPVLLMEIRKEAQGRQASTTPAQGMLGRNREWLSYFAAFAGTVAVANVPIMVLNFGNFLAGYQFVGNWGLEDAWYVWIFQDPSTWGYAKVFGLTLAAALILGVYAMKATFESKVFLSVAAYLLGTYIYSPQFNILVIPLLGLLAVDHPGQYLWDAFNALIILTWFIGDSAPGWGPTLAGSIPQTFALLRAVLLAWMFVSVVVSQKERGGTLLRRVFWVPGLAVTD